MGETYNLERYKNLYQQLKEQWSNIKTSYSQKESELVKTESDKYEVKIANIVKSYQLELEDLCNQAEKAKGVVETFKGEKAIIENKISSYKSDISLIREKILNHSERVKEVELSISSRRKGISDNQKKSEEAVYKIEDYKSRLSVVKQMETFASRDFRLLIFFSIIITHYFNES